MTTAWDMLLRDDPLEAPEQAKTKAYEIGATASTAAVTLNLGPVTTATRIPYSDPSLELRWQTREMQRLLALRAEQEVYHNPYSMGAMVSSVSISSAYSNYGPPRPQYPYPRNRRERLMMDRFERKLPSVVKAAERFIGVFNKVPSENREAWNEKFWAHVTRDGNAVPSSHRAKRPLR